MLLYPGLTQLDLTGPFEVLHRLPETTVHLVWRSRAPVEADSRMAIMPSTTFADCPPLDVLFVPGGPGQQALMTDDEVLGFVRTRGRAARWVTSVCTGALVLGQAGLLEGRRATTHWAYLELLPLFGAIPIADRVVLDGNLVTAGGVTAGIDFGLRLAATLRGDELAKLVQLSLEYDPAPPFASGHPRTADPALVEQLRATRFAARVELQRALIAARPPV